MADHEVGLFQERADGREVEAVPGDGGLGDARQARRDEAQRRAGLLEPLEQADDGTEAALIVVDHQYHGDLDDVDLAAAGGIGLDVDDAAHVLVEHQGMVGH